MTKIRTAPKTDSIYSLLKRQIEDGAFPRGVLPVEPELAARLQVSRKTLRSALARLALENYIVRVKGEGTFINREREAKGRILVLVQDMEDVTNPARYILPGIQHEADAMNLEMETCSTLSLLAGPPDLAVRRILRKKYCGILSMDSNFFGSEPILGILKKTGLPVILPHALRRDSEITGFAVLGTDYWQVMSDGLRYLAGLGHRRVAYLSYREFRISRTGYFQLLSEIGLDGSPELYGEVSSFRDHDAVMASIERLFAGLRKKPSAVFCFSDYFAVCLYEYLNRRELRIPEDVAVLSIGGMIGCDFLSPPLSAIWFDCAGIGRTAVRTLMEMRSKNEITRPFAATPHYLTERESTRKPETKETRRWA